MKWQVSSDSEKHLKEIKSALKKADKLILATDPDREGEAISWHVLEHLKEKKLVEGKAIERVVFNEVTKHFWLKEAIVPQKKIRPFGKHFFIMVAL